MKKPPPLTVVRRPIDEESEFDTRPLSFRLIRRLFSYTRPYAWKRNALFGLAAMRAIQLASLVWAVGAIINGPVARKDLSALVWAVAAFYAWAVLTLVTFHFRQRFALELGEALVHDLRNLLFQHLLRLPMSFFDRTKVGRIITRFTTDIEYVRVGVQDVFFVSLVQGGQMLVAAALMCWYDWKLFGVLLAMGPMVWGLNRYFRKRISAAWRVTAESFSRVTATVAESVKGVRVIQGFGRLDINAQMFHDLVVDHSRYNVRAGQATAAFTPLLELNTQFFVSALVLLGGYRVIHGSGDLPIGNLIQFFFLSNLFFSPIQALAGQYTNALTAMVGAERVFRFLDTAPEWQDAPDAVALESLRGRVEFDHVSFSYAPDRPALRDVSFVAEPGQTVALVGHTGSGKTTIVNLIAKFYLPVEGRVLIDGRDVLQIRSESLHRHLGIVLQQNLLFTGTVMENIRLGRPAATDAEVMEAARSLGCMDLIEAMPDGLQTRVGEDGGGISLGQRQVICFARAMLADPDILILDEATSSVDAVTERRLQEALEKLLAGRTSFVIAHRLSTIRHADVALVLEQGRIVERGKHRELLKRGGAYARLYRQFLSANTI